MLYVGFKVNLRRILKQRLKMCCKPVPVAVSSQAKKNHNEDLLTHIISGKENE